MPILSFPFLFFFAVYFISLACVAAVYSKNKKKKKLYDVIAQQICRRASLLLEFDRSPLWGGNPATMAGSPKLSHSPQVFVYLLLTATFLKLLLI